MKRKFAWLLLSASVSLCFVFAGCNEKTDSPESGFPKIKVTSGNADIEWVVGMDRLGNVETDREDNLIRIMKDHEPDELVHLKNGAVIEIEFDGKVPDVAKVTEHIITPEGLAKYQTEYEGKTIDIQFKEGEGAFTLEPNCATAFSSDSADYAQGATLKGYRLRCSWGTDECEYAFVIRGDAAIEMETSESYKPRELLNYYYDDDMPWGRIIGLDITEFPGVTFHWTDEEITAGDKDIILGMPIWNVYLADLNGDNLPEICATVSVGSGIVDNRIAVYDQANKKAYELSARTTYDYVLSLENGELTVTKIAYAGQPGTGEILNKGGLAIVEGNLVMIDMDSAKPEFYS